jgi:hypothetical protein
MIAAAARSAARGQVDPDQFGRAAADVDHQQLFGLRRDQRRAGDHGQPRLFLGLDDLQRRPVSRRT